MEVKYMDKAMSDIKFWRNNKPVVKKINVLIRTIIENPYQGVGKPEALKHELRGLWLRRINDEHRLIYSIDEKKNNYHIFPQRALLN